jgi:MoxR-like ATPase
MDDVVKGSGTTDDAARLRERVQALLSYLEHGLAQRKLAARALLLAALSGEHALLFASAGTAKTTLARRLAHLLDGPLFEASIDEFTAPEELFGPWSVRSLEQDELVRCPRGFVQTASVSVLQGARALSAACRTELLRALDRPEVGSVIIAVESPIDASSGPRASDALTDRFVLRASLAPLNARAFEQMLGPAAPAPPAPPPLSAHELDAIRQGSARLSLSTAVRARLALLRGELQPIAPRSDRWWARAAKVLRVAAFCDGRDVVTEEDLVPLRLCFDGEPAAIERLDACLYQSDRTALDERGSRFAAKIAAFSAVIDADSSERVPVLDERGQPLFVGPRGERTAEKTHSVARTNSDGERLYRAPTTVLAPPVTPRGYTAPELYLMFFQGQVSQMRAYVDNPANALLEDRPNEPLTTARRLSEALVDQRIGELAELALELKRAREECAATNDAGASSLWSDLVASPISGDVSARALRRLDLLVDEVSALRAKIAALPVQTP